MIERREAFKHIRRLQIQALHRVDDLFAGIYRSIFKGKGLEFEDVREYKPGDEIRSIDWNVTARSQTPFVKNYREERELTVMLVVDISSSNQFSHLKMQKCELIAEIAALLAFSAIKNQDKLGLLLFSEEIELYLKPKKGTRHVVRVIHDLLYYSPKYKGTNLQKALSFFGKIQEKKTICFLISDFLTNGFNKEVSLIAKRHDLIAFHIFDTYEQQFLPKGLYSLKDLETGEEKVVDAADLVIQENYQKEAEIKIENTRKIFEQAGADYFRMHTGENSSDALQRFFRLRKRKIFG